jgi:phage shock protein E
MRVSLAVQLFLIFIGLIIIYGLWTVINNVALPNLSPNKVTLSKAKSLINNNYVDVVIDVRTPQEIKQTGAYPGSVNIPFDSLSYVIPNTYPDKTTRILIYCRTGKRANKATELLRSMGYTSVYFITESYDNLM